MDRRQFLAAAAATPLAAAGSAAPASPPAAPGPEEEDRLLAARFHVERRLLSSWFGDIAYIDRGRGPAALFLHGFPLNGFQWRGLIDRVADVRRCIAPDFLGLGFTRAAEGQSVAPQAQMEMLVHLLDRLGVDKVDLVASDSGGAIAQLLLAAFPQRVRTLLLTNCDAEGDNPPPALRPVIDLAREGRFADAWLVPWFRDHRLARTAEGLGGLCYSRPGWPSDAAIATYLGPLVATPLRKAQTDAYALGLEPHVLEGMGERLRTIPVPARIVWGMGDPIFSRSSPDRLHAALPGSRGVRRVADGKLFFPEEYPDLMAEEARRLWGV